MRLYAYVFVEQVNDCNARVYAHTFVRSCSTRDEEKSLGLVVVGFVVRQTNSRLSIENTNWIDCHVWDTWTWQLMHVIYSSIFDSIQFNSVWIFTSIFFTIQNVIDRKLRIYRRNDNKSQLDVGHCPVNHSLTDNKFVLFSSLLNYPIKICSFRIHPRRVYISTDTLEISVIFISFMMKWSASHRRILWPVEQFKFDC